MSLDEQSRQIIRTVLNPYRREMADKVRAGEIPSYAIYQVVTERLDAEEYAAWAKVQKQFGYMECLAYAETLL